MKNIVVKYYTDEDFCEYQKIILDGKVIWKARDLSQDSPEDATLSRDMTTGSDILSLCKLIGSEFEETNIECETQEEFDND